jgi:transposase
MDGGGGATAASEEDADDGASDDEPSNPRRYYNRRLRAAYRQLPIRTHGPCSAAPNAIDGTQFQRRLHRTGEARWCHSRYTPLVALPPAIPGSRFRPLFGLDDDGGDVDVGADDRDDGDGASTPRAVQASKPLPKVRGKGKGKRAEATPEAEGAPAAKQRKRSACPLNQRKEPLQGALRTYKVRLWPTPPQRRELERTLAAARWAYNWCVRESTRRWKVVVPPPDAVAPSRYVHFHRHVRGKDGAYRKVNWGNAQSARDAFKALGKSRMPARLRDNVNDKVLVEACADFAKALKNGFNAVADGQVRRFDVHFRSWKRTNTEVFAVPKRAHGTSSLFTKFAPESEPPPHRRRSARHATARLHFGSDFKALGGILLQDKARVVDRLLAEGSCLQESALVQYDKRVRAWYFLYRYDCPRPADPDPTWASKRVGALDGGIRDFQRFCTTDGQCGTLVCGSRRLLETRVCALDDLHSRCVRKRAGQGVRAQDKQRKRRAQRAHDRINAAARRRRRALRQGGASPTPPAPSAAVASHRRGQRCRRLERKLCRDRARQCNWVRAVHYDAIHQLLDDQPHGLGIDVLINPPLRTHALAARDGRVFGEASTRAMLTWSHHKFNERLRSAAHRLAGRHVASDTGEPGTTRTCPNAECGRWHRHLGGNHTFACPHCCIVAGRDDVGARGNLLAAYGKAVGILADGTSNQ